MSDYRTKQHERDRVSKMTDAALDVRYGKMTKGDKIEAFFEELKKQGRNNSLQMKIAQDMGYEWDDGIKTNQQVHTLAHPTKGTMKFIPEGDAVVRIVYYDGATHKSLKDGSDTTEDARTGIERARKIWNEKVQEGWNAT